MAFIFTFTEFGMRPYLERRTKVLFYSCVYFIIVFFHLIFFLILSKSSQPVTSPLSDDGITHMVETTICPIAHTLAHRQP